MNDPERITGYHAHVYYDDAKSRAAAADLRAAIAARFEVRLGRWRDDPVGPHPKPMYQVAFGADAFARIVPWLALNHRGLSVLIHPETGDDPIDHSEYALWLGEKLSLDIDYLRRIGGENPP
ncbi:MAG TPA: DOPA 4,5-dioxygenase family protein [Alphaproteobacteria bacterium]|nr:DOPA 4,5-dioxygenase family protein [Alphaproteobacteria bacterium]